MTGIKHVLTHKVVRVRKDLTTGSVTTNDAMNPGIHRECEEFLKGLSSMDSAYHQVGDMVIRVTDVSITVFRIERATGA